MHQRPEKSISELHFDYLFQGYPTCHLSCHLPQSTWHLAPCTSPKPGKWGIPEKSFLPSPLLGTLRTFFVNFAEKKSFFQGKNTYFGQFRIPRPPPLIKELFLKFTNFYTSNLLGKRSVTSFS